METPVKPFMPGPNQKKAVEALKSKQFKQAYGYLGRLNGGEERNCCLGVFARIFGCTSTREYDGNVILFDGERCGAPPAVVEALALRTNGGDSIDSPNHIGCSNVIPHPSLIGLNDNHQDDFKTVIEALEKYPEQYFMEPR